MVREVKVFLGGEDDDDEGVENRDVLELDKAVDDSGGDVVSLCFMDNIGR